MTPTVKKSLIKLVLDNGSLRVFVDGGEKEVPDATVFKYNDSPIYSGASQHGFINDTPVLRQVRHHIGIATDIDEYLRLRFDGSYMCTDARHAQKHGSSEIKNGKQWHTEKTCQMYDHIGTQKEDAALFMARDIKSIKLQFYFKMPEEDKLLQKIIENLSTKGSDSSLLPFGTASFGMLPKSAPVKYWQWHLGISKGPRSHVDPCELVRIKEDNASDDAYGFVENMVPEVFARQALMVEDIGPSIVDEKAEKLIKYLMDRDNFMTLKEVEAIT